MQPTFFQAPAEFVRAPPFQQYNVSQLQYNIGGFQAQASRPFQGYYQPFAFGYLSQYLAPGGYGAYPYYPGGM